MLRGVVVIVLLFTTLMLYPISYLYSIECVEVTVKDKNRAGDSGESTYLIYVENEVFENKDSFLFLKFNSSDIYNSLTVGETYKIKVAGWRIPTFSWYRNVIYIDEE